MTPARFTEMGRALYGEMWQSETARALGVSDRTVRRWLSNGKPVPDGVEGEMVRLLGERVEKIEQLTEGTGG
jgi:DNA-binding transcriptional regulator YiaG